jgi:hypothetical protein
MFYGFYREDHDDFLNRFRRFRARYGISPRDRAKWPFTNVLLLCYRRTVTSWAVRAKNK